jgi:4,5-DOPA dioxygenase extradiol
MSLKHLRNAFVDQPKTEVMPALFVGHGSPMNAIEDNAYAQAWRALGARLPKPKAILSISAHWLSDGETSVHMAERPRTIHDFWGFPKELNDMRYPCPGAPELAESVRKQVEKPAIRKDMDWGIDHGTWIVLARLFPKGDIPVFQLSIDFPKHGSFHYELGKELAYLRQRGVLVMGSGNIVHNLGRLAMDGTTFDWALEFDAHAKELLIAGDHQALLAYEKLGHAAKLSVPTPDHYWPLLYVLGLQAKDDAVSFPVEGIDLGSVSMRTMLLARP